MATAAPAAAERVDVLQRQNSDDVSLFVAGDKVVKYHCILHHCILHCLYHGIIAYYIAYIIVTLHITLFISLHHWLLIHHNGGTVVTFRCILQDVA